MADIAYMLGFSYGEMMEMDFDELLEWHSEAIRLFKLTTGNRRRYF